MRRKLQGDLAIVSHGLFIRQFIEGRAELEPGERLLGGVQG